MNGISSEKSSSSSSKLNFGKVYIVTEGKQKKSKRKKKNKKCSRSGSWKSDVEDMKLASDEDIHALWNSEAKALGRTYQDSKNTSSIVTQTVKLPLLVSGSVVSTFIDKDPAVDYTPSALPSGSTCKQTSNGYCPDQLVDSSSLAKFNNINVKQKLPSKNKSRHNNSGNKQSTGKQFQTNKDKDVFKVTSINNAPSLSSSTSALNINNCRQLCSNSINSNKNNESLRWESVFEDSEEELERIRVYKMNRRKRYLAAAQAKGLSWAVSHGVSSSFQLGDNIGLTSVKASSSSYTDYRPIRNLGISQVHSRVGNAAVES